MIYYLVMARQATAMQAFLSTFGSALAGRVSTVAYEAILAGYDLDPAAGTFIFTNLNAVRSFKPENRAKVQALHDRLLAKFGPQRVHNDPERSLTRYEFLRALYDAGINSFNAHRLEEHPRPARYPVFIREESGTENSTPMFIRDAQAFDAAMRGLSWQRQGSLAGLIAVEFCDTVDAGGLYRKYSAFVVGSKIVPRHLVFSKGWLVKVPNVVTPELVDEEVAYMDENPHQELLLACARIARTPYGRFDFALLNGRPQVFEINTNSQLASARTNALPVREIVNVKFGEQMVPAFLALDD